MNAATKNVGTGDRQRTVLRELFGDRTPSRWVTRERPKIDRVACPWLILRFIDPRAEFIYVPTNRVFATAKERDAIAFDIPGAPFSHVDEKCSFDAFIERFSIEDAGVLALALIVRGADTDQHDLAPEAAGLHALSLGFSLTHQDDHAPPRARSCRLRRAIRMGLPRPRRAS